VFGAVAAAAFALAPLPRTGWALLLLAGLGGMLLDRADRWRPPNALLTVAGVAGFLSSLLPLQRETLAEQSLTALAFLLSIKLLWRKRRRDHLQVLAISLLIVAGAASLDPGLLFGALLVAHLVLGVLVLLWLPFSESLDEADATLLRKLTVVGAALAAASLPLALLLFVALPRSVNPFWIGLAGRPRVGVSGVAEHLQLGDVSRVALSGEVAFRAELADGRPLDATPYWRGSVLGVTDGRRWEVSGRTRPPREAPPGTGRRVTYYLEPHGGHQLFLLETPTEASVASRTQPLGAARVLRLGLPVARRIRYVATSVPGDRFRERLLPEERALNLRLPPALSPAVVALARGIAGSAQDPASAADRLLAHFSRGFTYSLQVPLSSSDPLEDFLLRHRTGYCEYFASGLATMLRAAGIPARVVSGYLGGEFVAEGSYYLVTQASAHAWVEAYLGEAWVRLDPTPAAGETGRTFAARRSGSRSLWLDLLRMRWNSWVIQYDAESQFALARAGAARARSWRLDSRGIGSGLALALGAAAMTAGAIFWRRRPRGGPLALRISRFEALAARGGARRESHEGPIDHAARFALRSPGVADDILRFGALAASCRYGSHPIDAAVAAELDALLSRIRGGSRARAACAASCRTVE